MRPGLMGRGTCAPPHPDRLEINGRCSRALSVHVVGYGCGSAPGAKEAARDSLPEGAVGAAGGRSEGGGAEERES